MNEAISRRILTADKNQSDQLSQQNQDTVAWTECHGVDVLRIIFFDV
ncbi:hypothetical protein [Kineobactrum salinum]|uniref:Uncharacterized protein n=1 Tax=Kineobactrum salinum TaxID=2708301 RepID=A0A6C0U219_9GAMM|nr:hypothetical protein [Kineobactrum salinum]QIB65968.1 hypothetical protein G3T16_11605 [Kineobactrum salinum]